MPQSLRILVTRPLEDGETIAAKLRELGHKALLAPLLTPRYLDGPEPALDDVQAILATSANGIRALVRRTARRDMAVFAVGPQTAQEAKAAGFTDVRSADGDVGALAQAVSRWTQADRGALLHVCSAEAPGSLVELLNKRGFTVRRAALYRVEAAAALPGNVRAALAQGAVDGAMFFSPRSARVFCDLAGGLPPPGIAFCISAATAEALSLPFGQVQVAATPNQDAMLALVE